MCNSVIAIMNECTEDLIFYKNIEIASKQFDLDEFVMEATNSGGGCISRLISFLMSIVSAIQRQIDKLITSIKQYHDSAEMRKSLKEFKKSALEMEKNGETIEFYDVFKYSDTYKKFAIELTNALDKVFSKETWKTEMTAHTAESIIKKTRHIVDHYNKEFEKIQAKKVQLSPSKLVEWLDKNINPNTAMAAGMLKVYMREVDKGVAQINSLQRDLVKYGERTGYAVNAKCVRDHINNTVIYMKKNSDWLSNFAVSGVFSALKVGLKGYSIASDVGADKLKNPDYWGSDNQREDYFRANEKYKKNNRRSTVSLVLDAGVGAGITTGLDKKHKAKSSGRNSIYNKQ